MWRILTLCAVLVQCQEVKPDRRLNGTVTSEPLILYETSIYIPNFWYNGDYNNARFWVGNSTVADVERVLLLDENNSSQPLGPYHGKNLTLTLPSDLTTSNIYYFGVWAIHENKNLGSVLLREYMHLPKCCPVNQVLTSHGCRVHSSKIPFEPKFKIFEHNMTHFKNESMNLAQFLFVPNVHSLNCTMGKYSLDETNEEFALLRNTSLLIKSFAMSGIISTKDFCLENIEDNGSLPMKILVCAPEEGTSLLNSMFYIYVIFTALSTVLFIITFFLYWLWLKVHDVHKRFFMAYCFTMAITFMCLTMVQLFGGSTGACKVLGFFFQIFMISSFTLLGVLCVDITIIIKSINENIAIKKRTWCYLGASIGVPMLALIISISRNLTPDVPDSFFKPQYFKNSCYFQAEEQRLAIFYIFIGLALLVSAICLGYSKYFIQKNNKENSDDYFWIEYGKTYKFMWRKHFLIFVTSLMWCVEILGHIFFGNATILLALDLVESTQGILVFILFVVNKETRFMMWRKLQPKKEKTETEMKLIEMAEDGLQ